MKTKHLTLKDIESYSFGYESNSLSVELKNGKCFVLRGVRASNFLEQIKNSDHTVAASKGV
jgi:hypothetical protein